MRTLLTVAIAFGIWSCSAKAASIDLVQGGWSEGGPLVVSFTGEDGDSDGAIEQSELNAFNATWVTPLGELTTWKLPDIEPDGFLFIDLGDYLFFTRNEDYSLVNTSFEGEALASVFDQFLFPVSSTAASPTAVPEPYGLSAIGLAILSIAKWRRRRTFRPD
jgi:hypothetical protein